MRRAKAFIELVREGNDGISLVAMVQSAPKSGSFILLPRVRATRAMRTSSPGPTSSCRRQWQRLCRSSREEVTLAELGQFVIFDDTFEIVLTSPPHTRRTRNRRTSSIFSLPSGHARKGARRTFAEVHDTDHRHRHRSIGSLHTRWSVRSDRYICFGD